jgi:hypothetical protein
MVAHYAGVPSAALVNFRTASRFFCHPCGGVAVARWTADHVLALTRRFAYRRTLRMFENAFALD